MCVYSKNTYSIIIKGYRMKLLHFCLLSTQVTH